MAIVRAWMRVAGALAFLLLVEPASAIDSDRIQAAIDAGVQFLQKQPSGVYTQLGATALRGLTLLECSVAPEKRAVQDVAAIVRKAVPGLKDTYSLALAIMFLDRLGDEADVPLIQVMGIRLLAGQTYMGGWTYQCVVVGGEEEIRRLTAAMRKHTQLRATQNPPKPRTSIPQPPWPELPRELRNDIEKIQARLQWALDPRDPTGVRTGQTGDNSNTQFAILGLWIARRYGVPVEAALAAVQKRFRLTQNADGGWAYIGAGESTATMTCAGLLGLAVGHGIAREVKARSTAADGEDKKKRKAATPIEPARDPAVRAGLIALATTIGLPPGKQGTPAIIPPRFGNRIYYFFWSLERVAVAYDLRTIGRKDWYAWGAPILVASQARDGSWLGEHGPDIDTCFALLFLCRANLAKDLTASLRGRVKDPIEVSLKSGGVGGADLKALTPRPGFNPLEKPKIANSSSAVNSEVTRLSGDLVHATPDRRDGLFAKYRDAKGGEYSSALARAIPQLEGDSRKHARDALAERLMRMTAATLRDKLRESDPEMRYAAARACASKEDHSHIPDLIPLLQDPEPSVVRAARAALRYLSKGQDFGTDKKAVAQWQAWWKVHGPELLNADRDNGR